ncbi:MAG: hypothetical protein IKH75_14355 [Ruminococcus sp.]|nr:hypothetical protein [Ruminococcus sp.]
MTEFEQKYIEAVNRVANGLFEIADRLHEINEEAFTSYEVGEALKGLSTLQGLDTMTDRISDSLYDQQIKVTIKKEQKGEAE